MPAESKRQTTLILGLAPGGAEADSDVRTPVQPRASRLTESDRSARSAREEPSVTA